MLPQEQKQKQLKHIANLAEMIDTIFFGPMDAIASMKKRKPTQAIIEDN